ncbi:MAG: hypothetical protein V3U32_00375 [Anaerolineales bacterium]
MANQHQSKPKEFSLHWGSGIVEEEVQITTEHHRPTIQLLKFLDGEAAGSYEIRFCHYDHRGRFQRSPLILDVDNLQDLGKEVSNSPKLREFLARLTTE